MNNIFDDKNWVYEELNYDLVNKDNLINKELLNNIRIDIENTIIENLYSYPQVLKNKLNNYLDSYKENIKYNVIINGINDIDIYLNINDEKKILNFLIKKNEI